MGNRASVYGIGFKRIFKSSNSIIFLIVVVLCLLIGSANPTAEDAFQTNPDQACRFVELTNIDALAVAIGTVHGVYKFKPRINIARLEKIAQKVQLPLVLHGGSGTPEEKVREAMELLAPMPMEERLVLECLQPQRADIVVHGIAILLACMNALDLPAITVSEYGNLEGYLKVKYLYSGKI